MGFKEWEGGIHRVGVRKSHKLCPKKFLKGKLSKLFVYYLLASDDYSFWNSLSLGGQNATNTSYIVMKIILSQYLRADLLVDDRQIDF